MKLPFVDDAGAARLLARLARLYIVYDPHSNGTRRFTYRPPGASAATERSVIQHLWVSDARWPSRVIKFADEIEIAESVRQSGQINRLNQETKSMSIDNELVKKLIELAGVPAKQLIELVELQIRQQHELIHELRKTMAAIDNATAALTRLQSLLNAAVTLLNTPHPTDVAVQGLADGMNAQSDRLDAAVTPPNPAPAPAPAPAGP